MIPYVDEIYEGKGGKRQIVAVVRFRDGKDCIDIHWVRPDRGTSMMYRVCWLPTWRLWLKTAKKINAD